MPKANPGAPVLTAVKTHTQKAEEPHQTIEEQVTHLVLSKAEAAFAATPFGNSVKTIMEVIQDEMLPKVVDAHEHDQDELNRLSGILTACGTTKDTMVGIADESKDKYEEFSPEHKKCREGQAGLSTALSDCYVTVESKATLETEKCEEYD